MALILELALNDWNYLFVYSYKESQVFSLFFHCFYFNFFLGLVLKNWNQKVVTAGEQSTPLKIKKSHTRNMTRTRRKTGPRHGLSLTPSFLSLFFSI